MAELPILPTPTMILGRKQLKLLLSPEVAKVEIEAVDSQAAQATSNGTRTTINFSVKFYGDSVSS